jgi:2-polyprenyl-3-methyl-5-hydroxy-6-metoxy-1,4-benzoquinol methylase
MDNVTLTACPLCDSPQWRPFARLDHRTIVRCGGCRFIYAREYSGQELTRVYEAGYYASPDDPRILEWVNRNQATWAGLVRDVLLARPQLASLLDVGAGTGGFLEAFHHASPATALAAIESSAHACASLARRLPELRFPAQTAEELDQVPGQYEGVTLLQCLEHVGQPLAVLRAIHRRLLPGGFLFLTIPNAHSYDILLHGTRDSFCYPNQTHLHFFTDTTARRALRQAGFARVQRVARLGGGEHQGAKAVAQWALRRLGLSSELRYVAWR